MVDVVGYFRRKYGLAPGTASVTEIERLLALGEGGFTYVQGRDVETGLPRWVPFKLGPSASEDRGR